MQGSIVEVAESKRVKFVLKLLTPILALRLKHPTTLQAAVFEIFGRTVYPVTLKEILHFLILWSHG